jgi:hypothetical protein
MSHVTHLAISTPFPSLPALLSFTPANLTNITLSNFRCTSPLQHAILINLFNLLITPRLEELVLAGIDDGAWDAFLEFVDVSGRVGNGLVALERLTLKSLALHGVDQRFADAFPKIKCLALVDIDPSLVSPFLQDDKISQSWWQKLRILVNGLEIESPG